jgi:AcrR family transcriptional regulator
MPRSKEQFEEVRNQKIDLIETTAMKCFAKKGFHNTSISDIAKEAGISVGLTYNYFSSKEDLLKSIYIKGIHRVYTPLQGKAALTTKSFKQFIEHIFREIETNVAFWKLYFIVISQPEILNQFQEYMVEAATPIITSVIRYFRSQGVADPKTEALFLLSTLDGVCINYLISEQHYPLKKIKQKIIESYE